MLVACVLHAAHVYITAWEYCFFIVHLVRAFGDAYKLVDVRQQVSRLSCFYTLYTIAIVWRLVWLRKDFATKTFFVLEHNFLCDKTEYG